MIRINLLQERKARRADKGAEIVLFLCLVLVAGGAGLYFGVHAPLVAEVTRIRAMVTKKQQAIKRLTEGTKDFDAVSAKLAEVKAQGEAVRRLADARAVPAWLLRELSEILTKDRMPTMTKEVAERVRSDPNRQWAPGWDPRRVWIESFAEKGGRFNLRGGAESDADATQLALRLQSSAFFSEVTPEGGQTVDDVRSSVSFYRFSITGRVAY